MLKVEVTNTLGRTIGRAGHVFEGDAEYPRTVEVEPSNLAEILDCAHLTGVVVGADAMGEVPPGAPLGVEATEDAVALARAAGVDLFGVEGSGEDGKIYVKDVRAGFATGDAGSASFAAHNTIGPEIGYASTTDSPEAQRRAEEHAMRQMSGADQGADGNVSTGLSTSRNGAGPNEPAAEGGAEGDPAEVSEDPGGPGEGEGADGEFGEEEGESGGFLGSSSAGDAEGTGS